MTNLAAAVIILTAAAAAGAILFMRLTKVSIEYQDYISIAAAYR